MDIERLRELASKAWKDSDKVAAKYYLTKAWDILPSPKEAQADSYMLCRHLVRINLELNDLDGALEWANQLQTCDLNLLDSGDREFIKGKVLFEIGEMDKAKSLFEIADKKSFGRCFVDADKKYKKLISKTTIKKELSLDELIIKADEEFNSKKYLEALNYLLDCFNHDEGLENPFVYLRKGQCHFELNELDKSADALTRAYMLEGNQIFEDEDSKYFDFLKTRITINADDNKKGLFHKLFRRKDR